MGNVGSCCPKFFVRSPPRSDLYRIDDESDQPKPQKKQYSWDKKEKSDTKNFIISNIDNETFVKEHGCVNGQQFIIQNCKNCKIYLFDNVATVSVDDCSSCKIFIGPCKGSVFVRDCENLTMAVLCQQFRTRDCKNLDVYLSCQTLPIIESSSNVQFSCIQIKYDKLEDQMEQASLSPFNNRWSRVHDFTPPDGDGSAKHFTVKSSNSRDEDFFTTMEDCLFGPIKSKFPNISCDPEKSVVPLTMPEIPPLKRKSSRTETECLILIFQQQGRTNFQRNGDVISLLHHLREKDCHLVSCSETKMSEFSLERITDGKNFNKNLKFGTVIGLHLLGVDCSIVCRNLLETLKTEIGPFFVTDEKNFDEKYKNYNSFVDALNSV